ncbi:MAG: glycosyltransferase family 4 protein [Prevotella sp.]|nr:glycosyltransferase family 4 protein [Prevotella sp.]
MDDKGRPLDILLATPYKMGVGGISQWADNILGYYQSLEDPGVRMDVLPMGRKASPDEKSVFRRAWSGVADYSKIICHERRMLKARRYDVLHLCTSASISLLKDIVMLRIAKRHHVHTVVHFHFGRIPELKEKGNWEWKMLRSVVKMADVAVPIDQVSYEALASCFGEKMSYLPNPVALAVSEFAHSCGSSRRDERMVLYAGHCIPTKGVCELVSACKEIKGIRLVLAGHVEEPMRQRLEGIANGEPWLEILGEVPHGEILRLMSQCGVFVLPSYTEGFPNVILESMACGCAIVATTVGAIPEMIGEENGLQCGLLIPPRSEKPLQEALQRMLQEDALREHCRANARRRVNERYNMEAVWRKMLQIWHLSADTDGGK